MEHLSTRQQKEQRVLRMQSADEDDVALIQLEEGMVVGTNEDVVQPLESLGPEYTPADDTILLPQSMSYERIEVSDHGRQHNGNLNVNGMSFAMTAT